MENLQKKQEETEAESAKTSEQYKELQQENENTIANLKGEQHCICNCDNQG